MYLAFSFLRISDLPGLKESAKQKRQMPVVCVINKKSKNYKRLSEQIEANLDLFRCGKGLWVDGLAYLQYHDNTPMYQGFKTLSTKLIIFPERIKPEKKGEPSDPFKMDGVLGEEYV